MYRATDSTSAGEVPKSGKPCERLIAWRSRASRLMTSKMLTALDGSFDSRTRTIRSYRRARLPVLQPLPGFQGEERIPAPEGDDATVVLRLRKGARQQRAAQPAQLVAIQVVDEVAEPLGRRGCSGTGPMRGQRFEHPGVIAVAGPRGRHRLDTLSHPRRPPPRQQARRCSTGRPAPAACIR